MRQFIPCLSVSKLPTDPKLFSLQFFSFRAIEINHSYIVHKLLVIEFFYVPDTTLSAPCEVSSITKFPRKSSIMISTSKGVKLRNGE